MGGNEFVDRQPLPKGKKGTSQIPIRLNIQVYYGICFSLVHLSLEGPTESRSTLTVIITAFTKISIYLLGEWETYVSQSSSYF